MKLWTAFILLVQGAAVHFDPIKPTSKAPGTQRLKPQYDELDSSFAFNLNLRHYIKSQGKYESGPFTIR